MTQLFGVISLLLSVPSLLVATPLVHQIYYDAPGADANAVFTELSGPAFFDLDGWELKAINGSNQSVYRTISLGGHFIGADGFFLLAPAGVPTWLGLHRDLIADVDWQNGPDGLHLVDPAGTVVDAVYYGAQPLPPGFMNPTPDVDPGHSLIRRVVGWNSGDIAADFIVNPFPHPTQSVTALPEPNGWSLLSMGGILLMGFRILRRRFLND